VDKNLFVPLLSQRQLLIALDMENAPGYRLDFLGEVCRYNIDLLQSREKIVNTIYGSSESLSNEELKMLVDLKSDIYVVDRERSLEDRFNPEVFRPVFKSSKEQFNLYHFSVAGSEEEENPSAK
jgi:hypothetical protein